MVVCVGYRTTGAPNVALILASNAETSCFQEMAFAIPHSVSVLTLFSRKHPAYREECLLMQTMYIRVKRNKTTYFIQCDPTETTLSIKQKLQSLIDQPPSNQQLILLSKDNVLVLLDDSTLADQKVENDAIVALTLRKDDNEFEDVFIARPEDFMPSS
ncbi:hypothetical protein ABZP36_018669 [Zizania latifolia]